MRSTLERPGARRRPTDARIVAGLRAGEASAFEELESTYGRLIASWARTEGPDTEDVVQDVLFRVWRASRSIDPDTSLPPYLKTITANTLRDRWRAAGRKPVALVGLEPSGEVRDPAAATNTRIAVEQILGTLADRERNVLEMMYLSDLTVEETAKRLGVSEDAAKSLAARARRRLRGQLAKLVATSPAATLALLIGRAAEALQPAAMVVAATAAATALGAAAITTQREVHPPAPVQAMVATAPAPVATSDPAPALLQASDPDPVAATAAEAPAPAQPAPAPAPAPGAEAQPGLQPGNGRPEAPPGHAECPSPAPAAEPAASPSPSPGCVHGNSANAPGHSGEAPGRSGQAPGRSGGGNRRTLS